MSYEDDKKDAGCVAVFFTFIMFFVAFAAGLDKFARDYQHTKEQCDELKKRVEILEAKEGRR